jgi:hypothetical protein
MHLVVCMHLVVLKAEIVLVVITPTFATMTRTSSAFNRTKCMHAGGYRP